MSDLFTESDGSERPIQSTMQVDLLCRGRAAYQGGKLKRVIWQAPCGFGKTIVASEQTRLALDHGADVLHIVHRRRLVDQMIRTLRRFGIEASPIMQGRVRSWEARVGCASRDTLAAMLQDGVPLPKAKLLIWDECHVQAEQVQKWYLVNCPDAIWTGYTATPVGSNGRSLNPPYQALVCGAPTSEVIRAGRLCSTRVFNPDGIGRRRRKGDTVKPAGDPVEHWKKFAAGLPTVAYAATVADSQALAQRYNAAGIPAEHMDALTSDEEREAIFERSRTGQTLIICNCAVLIEGVDLPWLACCQLLRGCNSLVLWIQATGRVMRAFLGKAGAIILDHAAAAHDFGMPDWDIRWELGNEKMNAKLNKPLKERKPVTCAGCGLVFAGAPACPECGRVLPVRRRKSLMEGLVGGDGVLTEFTEKQNGHVSQGTLDRLFRKIYFIVRNKGGHMGQVAAIFSREAKMSPWAANLSVKLPGRGGWGVPAKDWRL